MKNKIKYENILLRFKLKQKTLEESITELKTLIEEEETTISEGEIEEIIMNKLSVFSTDSGRIFDEDIPLEEIYQMYNQIAITILKKWEAE